MNEPEAQEADVARLGASLRERRQQLGLTLRQVGDETGLSVGFISQLERGMTAPSLSSLYALARALRAPITTFFAPPERSPGLTRGDGRPVFSLGGPAYEQLTSAFPGSMLRGMVVHYAPQSMGEQSAHPGEELMVVLNGRLEIELDGATERLGSGDSFHFSSRRPHRICNRSDGTTTVLWCGTWDVFTDMPSDPNHDGQSVQAGS